MQCPQCQHENPAGAKFCNQCAAPLLLRCSACTTENQPGAKFCHQCATPLTTLASTSGAPQPEMLAHFTSPQAYTPRHLAEKILTSRSALEGERKQVTVLFCDLANSTAMAARCGPDSMHALLSHFFELALDAVHRYEGTVNQFLGDGFMALFGAPIAHEDHARRAVLAALDLQRTLHAQHAALGEPYGVRCAFRMGLNSGLVVVGSIGDNLRMDYSAIGDTTNVAARLQQLAEPDVVLVSESTQRLIAGHIRLEALPPVQVKGISTPLTPYKVVGIRPQRSPLVVYGERVLSRFVGRERELAVLEELMAQVEAGHGQVVGIVAEAGGGKSRLLYEFCQRLAGARVTYLAGRCLSYGSTIPYHPLIDIMRHNCGITETDSPAILVAKVQAALQEVGLRADDAAPYLYRLLGVEADTESLTILSPEAIKDRTFETLRQMSLNGSQQRPLICEIEDLHWIDKTSEDYLATLVESLAGAAILLLITYRPGYRPPWLDKSYATQLALRQLAPQDGVVVVRSVMQQALLPERLEQVILAKAEGNPFFLEELTRAVLEYGDQQEAAAVPDTIQGVLMARLDRLSEAPKRLLQTASVLGREFSLGLLTAIWDGPKTPPLLLQELTRLEFLYERTGVAESTYSFKHALTQEVAYTSLLITRRQALHAAAGRALEALYSERLEEVQDHLAYHYAHTNAAPKAVEYLTLVAAKAMRSYAHAEAAATLQEAIRHAERLSAEARDRCVFDLVVRQAECLFYLGRRQKAVTLLLGYQESVQLIQNPMLASAYYEQLALNYMFLGNREQAAHNAQRALEEAQRSQDALTTGRAYYALTLEDGFAGRLLQMVEHAKRAVALLEPTTDRLMLGRALYTLGGSYYFFGDLRRALEVSARVEAIGEAMGDRRLQTQGASFKGWALAACGDWEAGITACQKALACSPDAYETALDRGLLGYAYLEKGEHAAALQVLEQALQEAVQYRSAQVQSWFKAFLSDAYRLNRHFDQARDFAQQGLELARRIAHGWGAALAQRTLGRIAHSRGNLAEARAYLQEAHDTFASIHSRFELARTHLDLATLSHTQGDNEAAAVHLSTAHAWFARLQVPRYVERAEQLARTYGLTLIEVPLDKLTADLS
jgi:class 3 adenylate cyclase/tetratricopeptide (TPR) repeat protein